jgi:hypothetical protein
MRTTTMAAAVGAAMMAMTVTLFAAEQPAGAPAARSEPIYGYRMMNDQERNEYREKMRNARSADERHAVRDEHHKLMEARAKERGVTLPEPRGPRAGGGPGAGMGPGAGGPGKGMGPGSGMGPGAGKGPGARAEGKGQGYGPVGGKGPGRQAGEAGRGAGKGQGPRADCPGAADCPGPGTGKGPGPRSN